MTRHAGRSEPGRRVGLLVLVACHGAVTGSMLVTVPLPDAATAAARRAAWPDMRVDVNRVDADRLRVLPGIGPTLAVRIASDRDERGPFASMDDLTRVRRIGPDLVTRIRPFAYAGRARETPAAPTIGRTAP